MAKTHGGGYYVDIAQEKGCRVECGKGDHTKVYPPPNENGVHMIVVPMHRELATGTEHSIRKSFRLAGLLLVLLVGAVVLSAFALLSGI